MEKTWAKKIKKYVLYIALVTKNEELKLFNKAYENKPEDLKIMLGYNPTEEFLIKILHTNTKQNFHITGYGKNDKNEGVRVYTDAPSMEKKTKFITLSWTNDSVPYNTKDVLFTSLNKTNIDGITSSIKEGEIFFFLRNGDKISLNEIKERFHKNFEVNKTSEIDEIKNFIENTKTQKDFIVCLDDEQTIEKTKASSIEEAINIIKNFEEEYNYLLEARGYIEYPKCSVNITEQIFKNLSEEERKIIQYFIN